MQDTTLKHSNFKPPVPVCQPGTFKMHDTILKYSNFKPPVPVCHPGTIPNTNSNCNFYYPGQQFKHDTGHRVHQGNRNPPSPPRLEGLTMLTVQTRHDTHSHRLLLVRPVRQSGPRHLTLGDRCSWSAGGHRDRRGACHGARCGATMRPAPRDSDSRPPHG